MTPELGGQFQGIKSCSEWMFRVLSPAGIWRNPPLPGRGQSQQAFALPAVGRLKHPGGAAVHRLRHRESFAGQCFSRGVASGSLLGTLLLPTCSFGCTLVSFDAPLLPVIRRCGICLGHRACDPRDYFRGLKTGLPMGGAGPNRPAKPQVTYPTGTFFFIDGKNPGKTARRRSP